MILKRLSKILYVIERIFRKLYGSLEKYRFSKCGQAVVVCCGGRFSYENITIGNFVFIGEGANFKADSSSIKIGNKVMIGPRVAIIGGDHRFEDIIGFYMYDISEKVAGNDKDIVIEDDVWIGFGTIILKGVTVGRGSIVGAGSIVTKSIPPYSIYTGSPPSKFRRRWDDKQIADHEKLINKTIS